MSGLLSPARWLAALVLLSALAAGYAFWTNHQRDIGRAEITAQWTAEKLAESEAARQREKALTLATQGVDHAYQKDKQRRAAADRATAGRLRDFEAALAGAGSSDAAAATRDHGAGSVERELLGNCAASFAAMGAEADRLASKIVGLQGYVRDVCLALPP